MKVIVHDPVIISQAPPEVKDWGFWQFPGIHKLPDGRLLAEYSKGHDSATAYGLPPGQAISSDNGATWQEVTNQIFGGLNLPDGSAIRAIQKPSIPVKNIPQLPPPLAYVQSSYVTYTYYWRKELPPELQHGWWFIRRKAGTDEWQEEEAKVEVPHDLAYTTENVFVFPYFEHDRVRLSPDGKLYATLYALPQIAQNRLIVRRFQPLFLESADNGKTWKTKSAVTYYPNMKKDPHWDARDGFSEPQAGFLPNGSIMMLMRTDDGNGHGPMYVTYSHDNGASWEKPKVFDSFGVWPQVLALKNNTTIISYGRPGLYIRVSDDPAGKKWSRRMTIVKPDKTKVNTCAYSALMPLDDNNALIVYSHFFWPNSNGEPRKTLLSRRIEISK